MINLPKSLLPKSLLPKSLSALRDFKALSKNLRFDIPGQSHRESRLKGVPGFGTNPGDLKMWMYLPQQIPDRPPLVVVLHGCGQTAAGYDHGAGWSTLADRYGFALLMPEQQRTNNPNGCFNWFQPGDTQRGQGEAASIRQMIETMVRDHAVDPHRVFVTGLSAGGAMTSVMLACYPDVFEAGAIVAGLPYGTAANVQQAFEAMYQCPARSPKEWGDAACHAYPDYRGPWPRVSIWHGGADRTVVPNNAQEIIKQWTYVHGLSLTPSLNDMVDGYPRQLWLDGNGKEIVEILFHSSHGARDAALDGRRRRSMRRCRTVPFGGRHFLVISYCAVLRSHRGGSNARRGANDLGRKYSKNECARSCSAFRARGRARA